MSRRFQFSLRALLVLMLAVACFFGGIRFERERRRREDEKSAVLPAPIWDLDDVQYFPPGPDFQLNHELSSVLSVLREQAAKDQQ